MTPPALPAGSARRLLADDSGGVEGGHLGEHPDGHLQQRQRGHRSGTLPEAHPQFQYRLQLQVFQHEGVRGFHRPVPGDPPVPRPRGEFLGGAFAPGIEISFDALADRAAQLRKVEAVKPRSVIGKNTVECLQSGMYFGFAGQVDRIVERMTEELGGEVKAVIATGGLAALVLAESETLKHYEPHLTLIGLRLVFEKNT